jgi:hypothetical protein
LTINGFGVHVHLVHAEAGRAEQQENQMPVDAVTADAPSSRDLPGYWLQAHTDACEKMPLIPISG